MRNKTLSVFLLLALAIFAYVGTAWYSGIVIEKTLTAFYQDRADQKSGLRFENRVFERGIFSSQESLVIDFSDALSKSMGGATLPADINPESLRIKINTEYKHGPLAEGKHFAAAVSHTRFTFSDEITNALQPLLQGKTAINMMSTFSFDRSISSLITIPSGKHQVVNAQNNKDAKLDWGEINFHYLTSGDYKHQQGGLNLQHLALHSSSEFITVKDAQISFDQKLAFDDLPNVYFGSTKLNVAAISGQLSQNNSYKTFKLEDLRWMLDIPKNDELGSAHENTSIQSLLFDGKQIGPLRVQLDIDRLHNRSLAEIIQIGSNISSQTSPNLEQALSQAMPHANTLLSHSPRLKNGVIEINTPAGKIEANATLYFDPLSINEIMAMSTPQLLAQMHLEANAHLVPEALTWLIMFDGSTDLQKAQIMTRNMLESSTQIGWLKTDQDNKLSSTIRLEKGVLNINGKIFDNQSLQPLAE